MIDIFNTERVRELEQENLRLHKQIAELDFWAGIRRTIHTFLDPSPSKIGERKDYVANVHVFYENILKKQIEYMIHLQQQEVGKFGLSERQADYLRANINVLYLLDEWCTKMQNEHFANIQEQRSQNRN